MAEIWKNVFNTEHNIYTMNKDLKYIALQLCTCTWIEIMTGAGITVYLTYLHSYMLAVLTLAVFAPLIGFHFVMARLSKSEDYCSSSTYLRRFSDTQTEDLRHIHQFVSQRRGIDINDAKI